MLHALPELLDALEGRLRLGEDPLPLLTGIRWSELVGWPQDLAEAQALKVRLRRIQVLVEGLQAPLRATLARLQEPFVYGPGPAGRR
ncbi:MAG TPA: hypothetical protein VJ570_05985 [Holophagaceae bacterium]|nr:hypothetical protein [Holophagaceae bacterium]